MGAAAKISSASASAKTQPAARSAATTESGAAGADGATGKEERERAEREEKAAWEGRDGMAAGAFREPKGAPAVTYWGRSASLRGESTRPDTAVMGLTPSAVDDWDCPQPDRNSTRRRLWPSGTFPVADAIAERAGETGVRAFPATPYG
ncbi:hypothetical protein GCM10027073_38130 [Streptomyces chlorus]